MFIWDSEPCISKFTSASVTLYFKVLKGFEHEIHLYIWAMNMSKATTVQMGFEHEMQGPSVSCISTFKDHPYGWALNMFKAHLYRWSLNIKYTAQIRTLYFMKSMAHLYLVLHVQSPSVLMGFELEIQGTSVPSISCLMHICTYGL